ncbi:MAG: hypothetical protein AB7O68_17010 [Pirellulales bacterium]
MVIYKKHLRKNMLVPLRVLSQGSPLTADELSQLFLDTPALATEIKRHFATLRLWHLIEETEPQRYAVTLPGMRFLQGDLSVPEWIWTLSNEPVATPEGEDASPEKLIYEIMSAEFSDASMHMEDAVPWAQMSIPA